MLTLLAWCGDTLFWCWSALKTTADSVLGFAGYPEDSADETEVPAWLGWLVWLVAVGGLVATVTWLAVSGGSVRFG